MTATDWIKKYEDYLTLVKNRAINTVRGYVSDVWLLYKFSLAGRSDDWATFTEADAVEYMRHLKASSKDTAVSRKIYAFHSFF